MARCSSDAPDCIPASADGFRRPRAAVSVLYCLETANHVDASIRVERIACDAVVQFRVEAAIPAILFCEVEGAPIIRWGHEGESSMFALCSPREFCTLWQ
jgi:hypothetical protein